MLKNGGGLGEYIHTEVSSIADNPGGEALDFEAISCIVFGENTHCQEAFIFWCCHERSTGNPSCTINIVSFQTAVGGNNTNVADE
jgi:hypothetical protein